MAEQSVVTPLPGTFYRKATPESPYFVEPGASVGPDTVIGLIEVMKQFSELTAGAAVLDALLEALPASDPHARLTASDASELLKRTAAQADVKGRALYHPIRLALTGSDSGPELSALLTLLTVDRIRERVHAANMFSPRTNKE